MTKEIQIDNPKEHFILHDSLDNIINDVTFSIFKKYTCQAGCRICYIRDDFLPPEQFVKHIPINVDVRSYADRLLNFLSYFNMAATIDDLRYVRDHHQELYRFYQEYSSVFWLSSMTDNAIFRHLPIIENELPLKGLREISMSEQFLYQVNMRKLFDAFDRIQAKAKIMKIKVILRGEQTDQQRATDLTDWCALNGVSIEKQYEHGLNVINVSGILAEARNARYSVDDSFSEDRTYSENGSDIYPIHSEALFLQYEDFYSELKSATKETRSKPFATLKDFDDPVSFLAKVLEGKKTDYAYYAANIQNKDSSYSRYFDYVSKCLEINHGFNFIPRVSFKPYSVYHRKLIESGHFIDTQYGLVTHTASNIIPIYTFKDHESIKL